MPEEYAEGQGVEFWVNSVRRGQKVRQLGLIVEENGDALGIVPVYSAMETTRFYDEAVDGRDECRDNVPLDSCPPPFHELCDWDRIPLHATGRCYVEACKENMVFKSKSECTIIDFGEKVSDYDLNLVKFHAIPRQDEKAGLSYKAVESHSKLSSDMRIKLEMKARQVSEAHAIKPLASKQACKSAVASVEPMPDRIRGESESMPKRIRKEQSNRYDEAISCFGKAAIDPSYRAADGPGLGG